MSEDLFRGARRACVVHDREGAAWPLPAGAGALDVRIDATVGCRNLVQRILRLEPGRDVELVNRASEDVLFVAEGAGRGEAGAERLRLEPGVAVLVPPGVRYRLSNRGRVPMVLVSVLSPQPGSRVLGWPEARRPGTTREREQPSFPAGEDRLFKVLIDPRYGSRCVTQFVGTIDRSRAPFHTHPYEEAIYVLDGHGLVHVDDRHLPVMPGSSVFLPPGTAHCVENTGEGRLRLLGALSPPGSPADRRPR